jgi:branched-chain amino acid transport system substrate-binding protein
LNRLEENGEKSAFFTSVCALMLICVSGEVLMNKTLLSLLATFAILAGTSAQETIKIGEFASLTGKEASFGQSSHNGTALAFEEINAAGGVLGKKIELIYEDDQSKAGQASTAVQKLLANDKVIAILGEVASSRSFEAAPICQSNKIPMITPASTNPEVTEKGDYIFRVCFTDSFQGTLLANYALKNLKVKKAAILIDTKSDYSVGLAQNFKQAFTAGGGAIVVERNYSGGDKDFRAQLTAIKSSQPEAVCVPGYYTDVGLIIRQARQVGIKVPLFGGDGWESPNTAQIAGSAIAGTFFSTHYSAEETRPAVQEFVKRYKAKYNAVPDAMAALGYDSALILADAIKRAGTTESGRLREAIAATKDFSAVTGQITLDEHRNARKSAVILKAEGNTFRYQETVAP